LDSNISNTNWQPIYESLDNLQKSNTVKELEYIVKNAVVLAKQDARNGKLRNWVYTESRKYYSDCKESNYYSFLSLLAERNISNAKMLINFFKKMKK
jgi:hypothetical protein